MARLGPPPPSEYNAEQKRIADSITSTRGSIRGPFGPWLHARVWPTPLRKWAPISVLGGIA